MLAPGVCLNIISERHTEDGYGSLSNPVKFLNQDFQQLKQYCRIRQVTYIDDMFPPGHTSIGDILKPEDLARVEWMRPSKIVHNPSFTVDGVSRFDFGQGSVGDCWFLASIGALTFQDFILNQVVPMEQRFDEDYWGLFHFRFWRFGKWVDVVIDDKLPTINGKLIFVHSKDPTEFWPALMEKAYAKVCGSYSDMNSGTPVEALVDFTGGVHMGVNLSKPPPDLFELMCRAGQGKTLMGCGTPQGKTAENDILPNGLVQGHAYAVTGVREVLSGGRVVHLVRLWNPWGDTEWIGDWSDRMTLEDFCAFYSDLDICCSCPDFLDGSSSSQWKTSIHEGRWVAGITAGGCMNNPGTFWTNPQFRVKIGGLLGGCGQQEGQKNMLVSLMQKPDKRNRRLVKNLHIGFCVFEVTEEHKAQRGKFSAPFFSRNRPVAKVDNYVNAREVMQLIGLKPGEYLIVPSTYAPNETASFILTIQCKAETHIQSVVA